MPSSLRSQDFIASGAALAPAACALYLRDDEGILWHFGLDTLRDLPDFEALEDAGLLSKEKLLAGDIVPTFAGENNSDDDRT